MAGEVSRELVGRAHANHAETFRRLARYAPDGAIAEAGGVTAVGTAVSVPMFNPAFLFTSPVEPEAALGRAAQFYAGHGLPWLLVAAAEAVTAVAPAVDALGLQTGDPMPLMVLPSLDHQPATAAGLEIRVARDAAALRLFNDVACRGFGIPREVMAAFDAPEYLTDPEMTFYLGYLEGDPVATSMRVSSHRIAGVYTVSTVPEARGRGIGEAMTWQAALGGRAEGRIAAALQASRMGFPIYRRMGFCHVGDYQTWVGGV